MTQAYTHNFSEVHEPGGTLIPELRVPGVYATPWRSVQNHQRGVAILLTGAQAPNSTIDLVLQQATNNTGAGVKAFTPPKAITQLSQVAGDDDDRVILEFRTEEMDVNNQFDFVRAVLTVGGANSNNALQLLLGCSNYPPVSVAEWTEVVI